MELLFSKYKQPDSSMKMLQFPTVSISVRSQSQMLKTNVSVNSITTNMIEEVNDYCLENKIKDLHLGIDIESCTWPDSKTTHKCPTISFDNMHFKELYMTSEYFALLYKNVCIELSFPKQSWFVHNYKKVFTNCTVDHYCATYIKEKSRRTLVKIFIEFFQIRHISIHGTDLEQFYDNIQKNATEVCITYHTSSNDKYINKLEDKQITLIFNSNTMKFPEKIGILIHALRLDASHTDVKEILKNINFKVDNIEIIFSSYAQISASHEFKKLVDTFINYKFTLNITKFSKGFTDKYTKKYIKEFMEVFGSYVDHKRVTINN